MSVWFTSRKVAVALGIITLLTLTARITFLDALYVPEFRTMLPEDQPTTIGIVMLVFMVFVGGWIWSLFAAARGSRAGTHGIAAFLPVYGSRRWPADSAGFLSKWLRRLAGW